MNALRKTFLSLLAVGLMSLTAEVIFAQQAAVRGAQASCGCSNGGSCKTCPKGCGKFECDCQCNKVCQPTMTTKKVTVTCWVCECKMICLAGPSCGCQGTCGRSRIVKRLVRKTITKEIPIVKCNAIDATDCGCASGGCDSAPTPSTLEVPQPPAASTYLFPFDKSVSLRSPNASSLFGASSPSWPPSRANKRGKIDEGRRKGERKPASDMRKLADCLILKLESW